MRIPSTLPVRAHPHLPHHAFTPRATTNTQLRCFHDYFITHIPSSSMHPDSGSALGPHHRLPREKSVPHDAASTGRVPATAHLPHTGASRDMTVVRIPIRSAKHHFGASISRGTRPYNEDAFQAGTIDIPAFAKRRPISLSRSKAEAGAATAGAGHGGDPQVFYFSVFDGHGGSACSNWLREHLHTYIEEGSNLFELQSSLKIRDDGKFGSRPSSTSMGGKEQEPDAAPTMAAADKKSLEAVEIQKGPQEEPKAVKDCKVKDKQVSKDGKSENAPKLPSDPSVQQSDNIRKAEELERKLVRQWKSLVGGYFRRFKPEYFSTAAGGQGHAYELETVRSKQLSHVNLPPEEEEGIGLETVLTYAFLKADYDFVSAQASKQDSDATSDRAINENVDLGVPFWKGDKEIAGPNRFKGGSTCSVAMISTPSPSPFWHPSSPSTIITAHVGDTRVLLCETATGLPIALTTNHHPSAPSEATRMRRYAAAFTTDSFGEERVSGLANTRAFGDMESKRIGVSAEPEIRRTEVDPAQYSFLVLVSDGVSGLLSDEEIVDIIKEARTPEQGARDVVSFATEITGDADNATALVVRLGGWERRGEGGLGSIGTKEQRDFRKQEAESPRGRTN